jgi:HPt (histidine-containing phosphotransfer) domain-containing protein
MVGDREALAQLLAEAKAEYRRTLPGKLAQIESLWFARINGTLPPEEFAGLQRLVHTIAGSAKTFGLPAVGDAARALELAISPSDSPAGPMPADEAARVRKLVEALRQSGSNG